MHAPRILNRAAQATESQGFEEGTTPDGGPAGMETTPRSRDEQCVQSVLDAPVHLDKLRRPITRAKILSPRSSHAQFRCG